MASALEPHLHLEVGHILFLDIVGYSKLLAEEQKELVQELNRIVRETKQFHEAQAEGKLTRLPTGDGMVLVFTNNAEAPVECALEISKALQSRPQLKLRMGIHSGPVNPVADVNDQANLAGAGINVAERVMACGDAGHILLSKHFAEDLEHYTHWRSHLHDIGSVEVKHGARISIVNFYADQLGNAALPAKLRQARTAVRFKSAVVAVLLLIAVLGAGFWILRRPGKFVNETAAIREKSIAVLPFENLSEEKANAYFAAGIQNEILTRLASVRDLKVISRTSTAKYQSKPDNLKTVAQELGVSTIVEGAVQKAGDKVRVSVQLINARADTHLWAKSYDRDFKDVLGVESEVSQEIAEALQANLSPGESNALVSVRTHDAEAYDLFLRGEYEFRQAESSLAPSALDRADRFYQQALGRDPNFVEAASELARSRLWRHWLLFPLAPAELEQVKSIVDRAVMVAPNSPEAHMAMGLFFYWGQKEYESALAEFNRTLELQPNNANARAFCAWVYRRRGEWERSLADSQRAQELDPRDATILMNIGNTYQVLRLWKDAERAELRALSIDPHFTLAATYLLLSRLYSTGDVGSARRGVDGFPDAIKSLKREWFATGAGDVTGIIGNWVYLDVLERRFTDAFQEFDGNEANNDRAHLRLLAGRAALRVLAGQTEAAKSAGEEARPLLEARFRERPDDSFPTELSWVYVALGRNTDALRVFREAADSISIEKDALTGPYVQNGLAQIEARAGAPEQAVKRLRHLLSIPAGHVVSVALLKIDPVWDPIRNRPDFQQLLAGPEQIGPNK